MSKYKTPTSIFPEHRGLWANGDHFHSCFPLELKKGQWITNVGHYFIAPCAPDVNENMVNACPENLNQGAERSDGTAPLTIQEEAQGPDM